MPLEENTFGIMLDKLVLNLNVQMTVRVQSQAGRATNIFGFSAPPHPHANGDES